MSTIAPPSKPLNPALVDSEHYIDDQIRRTRWSLKLVDFAAGLITLAIGLAGFVLAAAVLDHWVVPGGLNGAARAILFGVLMLGLAWYGWRQFVPLLRPINPVYAAHTIERGAPSLKNSLLNLLLFRTHRQHMPARVYHAIEQQAAQRLSTAKLEAAVDHSALLRLGYALVAIVALCALYAALSPKNMADSTMRVIAPWSDLAAPSRVKILDVKPGETSVARGERLAVSAELLGLREDEPVRVRYSTADEQLVDESISMIRAAAGGRFEAFLPRRVEGAAETGVQQDLVYWLEAGDARSLKFKLSVFERPTLIVQKVHYDYPAYTGFPSKDVGDTGDIRGLEGTQVTISAISNQPIKTAYVDFDADGRNDVRMVADKDHATATFPLELRDDRRTPWHKSYALRFTSTEGRANSDPPTYSIDVAPDYAPEVRITAPEEPERTVRVDEIVTISVDARDPDFALDRVQLVGKVGDEERVLAELLAKRHEGRYGATEMFTPADAQLKPGDVLEYWATAYDNRRPEANLGFSEHRRLKIVGAEQPPQGQPQQQPGAKQNREQQQEGDPQDGGQGQGGPQQPGGNAGADSKGAEGEGAQGPGGTAGGEGKPGEKSKSQPGAGGAGQSGESQGANQEQPSQGAGGGAGATKSQQQSPNKDAKNPSAGGNAGQSDQNAAQPNGAADNAGEAQQTSERNKVSPEGDTDGEAFDRIAKHLDNQNGGDPNPAQPKQGEQSGANAEQPPPQPGETGGVQAKPQQDPGEDAAATGSAGEQPQSAPIGDAQQSPSPNESPNQSAADKPAGAAGQSQNASQQKPPAEGAPPKGPAENAADATQQTQPAGPSPEKRQGANIPRKTKNGDGNKPDSQGAQKPSAASGMNRNGGDAGAGHKANETDAAPGAEDSAKQGRQKSDADNRQGMDDQEPAGASNDKKESDSSGGQSGDKSGGSQKGAGQKADAPGEGGAGQHEAADEGGGRAEEQGAGETGAKAGSDQKAAGETGESSGDQKGQGSQQGEPGEVAAATGPDGQQPGAQPNPNGAQPGAEGEPVAPARTNANHSEGSPLQPGGEQPGDESAGQPPQPGAAPDSPPIQPGGEQPSSDQPGKPSSAGASQPSGGGSAGSNAVGSQQTTEQQEADAANLEFARQRTDLILESLDQQLAKKQVDRVLLKSLGWNEAELRQFVDRWKNLKARANGEAEEGQGAKQELDAALRSLGLRKNAPTRFRAKSKADEIRDLNEGIRTRAPIEYADRVREYSKGVTSGQQ